MPKSDQAPVQSPIQSVGQIHISISDYARALAFYRDVLQLKLLFEVPEQSMAFFDCGGIRLYLGIPSSPDYHANSFLYYNVADIHAAHQQFSEHGVEFLHAPRMVHQTADSELWMAGFQDSEGNYAQLMSSVPLQG